MPRRKGGRASQGKTKGKNQGLKGLQAKKPVATAKKG